MILSGKTRIIFKCIAGLTTCIFFWQQVSFAADLIDITLDKLNTDQSQVFAPQYLQDQQVIHEGIVDQKQDIEDSIALQNLTAQNISDTTQESSDNSIALQGPKSGGSEPATTTTTMTMTGSSTPQEEGAVLSITTESGDIIHYKDGQIEGIETKDSAGGTILIQRIVGLDLVDADNNLLNAEITYADGTIQIVMNGTVSRITKPDGTLCNYNADELIESIVYPDGTMILYSYIKDDHGEIIETVLDDTERTLRYGANNRLKSATTKLDGTYIEYEDGILKTITKPSGNTYIFTQMSSFLPVPEGGTESPVEYQVTLSSYIDSNGTRFSFNEHGALISIQPSGNSNITHLVLNEDGALKEANITLEDGSVQVIRDGHLIVVRKPDNSTLNYNYNLSGNVSEIVLTLTDGTAYHYTASGDLTKKTDPSGALYYDYQNGIISDKAYISTQLANYLREYDYQSNPLKLTIREPNNLASTYLFNKSGALCAMSIDSSLPATTPFIKPKSSMVPAEGYMPSSGVLTTDGTYLYIKRWGSNQGSDTFEKIGTGLNGTVAGKNYGTLSTSSTSYSATYCSDGFIYNPISSNAYKLEKIDVVTGVKTQIDVTAGLLERSSGKVTTGYSMITSSERFVYNVAHHIDNGSTTTYNGWTIKVFDPLNNWQVVRTFTIAATSFSANGIVSDGQYLYVIQWTNTNSAKVAKISLETSALIGTFVIDQGTTNVINGQYDWVNRKFWLGSYSRADIYRYAIDEVNYTPLVPAKKELTFKAESVLNTTGVLTTDGTYYYTKRSSSSGVGTDTFQKIGTGLNGTIAGKNYGTLASSSRSYSATYYSDGCIYNPVSGNSTSLEKISVSTGVKTTVTVTAGLFERSSGRVTTGYSMITSDGRYVYNVAYHIDNGSTTTYNGWTVRVFDPLNNWQVVKTYTVGTSSYFTNGIVADGVYLYCIEWRNTNTARITISRISDGVIVKTYTINQGDTGAINGQYDFVNNKIVLGANYNNGIYTYDGLIQKTGLNTIDMDGFFTASRYSTLPAEGSLPDGSTLSYERDLSGNVSNIILTLADETRLYYTPAGALSKRVDPTGTTYYEYQDGITLDKKYITIQTADYLREYGSISNPFKLTIREPNNLASTYLFNASGALAALAIDADLPTATPFNTPKTDRLEAQGYMQSSGVLATDGTYLYIKRWAGSTGSNTFEKVGTGYNGTIAGENYGTLSTSSTSCAATYYSDGNIYNPVSTNATTLEKINVSTGTKTNITLLSGLLERSSGKIQTGYSLITSDGRYVYNLAYHIDNGSTTSYNGWTVKVYDPQNAWSVIKTFTTGTTSFLTDGIVCDGTYLYALQWTNTNAAQVAKISLSTNAVVGTFTINQLTTNAINGQYDWVNKKFYLGSYIKSDIYRYGQDLVNYTPLTTANQETTFKAETVLNSAGVLVTDGAYYYVKRSGTNLGLDTFQKIGTGLHGTIAGQNYGALSASSNSYSAAYYSDGNIYNPVSTSATTLEKINVSTGTKTNITLLSGLLERASGKVQAGYSLITSDGRYVYNVASHIDNGSTTTYNGWTVKIYDPQNNWSVVKTYTVGATSYSTSGIIADGVYVYFIESRGTDSAKVTVSRISDGVIVKTYTINQGQTAASGGHYDWVNNRIVLGASANNGTYTYNSFIKKTGFDQVNTDGMIAASARAVLSNGDIHPPVVSIMPNRTVIESETQFKKLVYDSNRILKKAFRYDGSTVDMKDGLVDAITDMSGVVSSYAYDISDLGNIHNLSVDREGIKRIYDTYGNIKSVSLDDATKIVYENGLVKEVRKSDGTTIKNISFRNSGELDSALISYPDGSTALYQDAELLEMINASGDKVEYADGKIRTVTLQDGTTYDWSYEDGHVVIDDNALNQRRTYSEGRMTKLEELAGTGLTITYSYDDATQALIRSQIRKGGDILYTYTYTYEDGLTLVHDEDGNTQAYTKEKKLSYIIDSKGRKYSYTYTDESGEYIEVWMPNGEKVRYTRNDIKLQDGTTIKDIVYGEDGSARDFQYEKDGTIYYVKDRKVYKTVSSDKTITEYYPNGFKKSVTTSDGQVTNYGYEISQDEQLNLEGITQNTQIIADGDSKTLELTSSPDPQTSLLLHLNGDDASRYGYSTAFYGDARLDTANQKFGSSALKLDGSGDYVTLPDSDNWYFGTGNFTIDFWVKLSDITATNHSFVSQVQTASADTWRFNYYYNYEGQKIIRITQYDDAHGAANYFVADFVCSNITTDWCHIALVRKGTGNNDWMCFLNGTSLGNPTWVAGNGSKALLNFNAVLRIGRYVDEYYLNGWIDELRVSKGVTRWTSNFTPPVAEYHDFYNTTGSFTSSPLELNATELNTICWNEIAPAGTDITIKTRTGNTENPDDGTWNNWSEALADPIGSKITSPAARYIQYKVNMTTSDPQLTPQVKDIQINYTICSDNSTNHNIAYITVTNNGITSRYDPQGINIINPNDIISISSLKFDSTYTAGLIAEAERKRDSLGKIIDIAESDGTVIKDLVFDENDALQDLTYIKDGVTYKVEDGKVKEAVSKDGTRTEYYDSGFVQSITTQLGKLTEYKYFVKDNVAFRSAASYAAGTAQNVSYYNANNTTYLTLSQSALEYGTGVDGVKRVSADETLAAGTYNFTSLIIDAGKTLTVSPGTTIHVLGEALISGAVFCGGSFDLCAHDVTVAATGTITGAVDIQCNTISNSGMITGNACMTGTLICGSDAVRDDNFSTYYSGPRADNGHVVTLTSEILFPSCHSASLTYYMVGYADVQNGPSWISGSVYLLKDGSWVGVGSSMSSVVQTNNGGLGWDNVTGIMMVTSGYGAGCGSASTAQGELQVMIGTPTVAYVNGNPGTVNTTPSRPAATQAPYNYPTSGTFESEVIELNALELGSLSWSQELPQGTNITFQTRTGDTLTPDNTWSAWSAEMPGGATAEAIPSAGKYLQYRLNLSTANSACTPVVKLSEDKPITIEYNRAPTKASDLSNLSYATVSKAGVLYGYNNNGLLIWTKDAGGIITRYNPPQSDAPLMVSDLVYDYSYLDTMKSKVSDCVLNDTQKEIFLRDSIIISELTAIKSVDGTLTEYCQGQISQITRPDGTKVRDISFGPGNDAEDFTYIRDGNTYIMKDGKIAAVETSAGERLTYYSYGLVKDAETGSSKKEYEYGVQTEKSYAANTIFQDGSHDHASFYAQNNTTYLALSQNTLEYGTGVDGAKRVSADETLAAGTYNFTSLIVDAGKTLTISPGTVINVLGEFTLDGKLFCGGSFDLNAHHVQVGASGSLTGAVDIICDTINNLGIISGNACLTGTLTSGSYAVIDDDFYNTYISGSHGASSTAIVTFQNCNVDTTKYHIGIGCYGISAYAAVNLLVNGSWVNLLTYSGSGSVDSGVVNNTTDWSNVSGMMLVGQSARGDCVSSGYALYEMQAIIGTPTIAYVNGSPGIVNTTPSRPTATQTTYNYPSSGTFESEVIEFNALELGSLSWSQELPAGTAITFQTRTGDTLTPDDTWSAWSQALTGYEPSAMSSPGKKCLQYKINLSSSNPSVTPRVVLDESHKISLSYTAISQNILDPYVKVKENNTTSAYNKNGALIWTEDALGNRTTYDPSTPVGTIDISSLNFDSAYVETLTDTIPGVKLSDAQKVITIYDKDNDIPVEIVTADQTITYFDQGLATKVVDKSGTTQVLYTYDGDKNILKTEFVYARQKLEENYERALSEIVTQEEAAFAKLADAESAARADIAAKSADMQAQIVKERERLTQERAKYDPNVYDLSEFSKVFTELDDYEARLITQTQDAYTDLDSQVVAARARIEQDAATAMQSLIENDYNKILGDIVQKESSPVIYQYYRKVLGRDPDNADLLYWMNIARTELRPITGSEVTQYLQDLSEYQARASRKEAIIQGVTALLAAYVSASPAEKDAVLGAFGIASSEAVTLTQSDIDTILSWLNGQSLHFGDSAIQTIVSMLSAQGITKTFAQIGQDAILVDILTGVITKDTTGDLLLSMYAMRKAAAKSGLILYSSKLAWDDLTGQLANWQTGEHSVIVHVDGKHYVLVTSIDDEKGTVTYTDPTVGQSGTALTVSKAEFMEMWRGFALSKQLPADPAKQLNVTQEKNIRGSGWWNKFWKGVAKALNIATAVVAAVLILSGNPIGFAWLGVNIMVNTIAAVVRVGTWTDALLSVGATVASAAIGATLNALVHTFNSTAATIPAAVNGAFSSTPNLFNTIASAVRSVATGIGHIITLGASITDKVATAIGSFVITQGVSLGTSFLFRSMGLDPSLSQIGSALFTGAVSGALNPDVGIISGILQSGTIAGVNELGTAINLDPNITHLAGMMSGALVGGMFTTPTGKAFSYNDLMKEIAPNIASECAYIGVTELGELLGVDPRISYLAGIGIRSSISAGLNNQWKPDVIWGGITQGLLQGVTSIGLEWAYDEIGVNPLFGAMTVNAIGAAFEAILNRQNIFLNIGKQAGEGIFSVFTLGGYGDNPWSQAVYISQVLDFSKMVQERGLLVALETYATSIFHQQTISLIVKDGGIYDMLTNRAEVFTDDNGILRKRLYADSERKYYIDINMTNNAIIEKKDRVNGVDVITKQQYGIDANGKLLLLGRTVEEIYSDNQRKISTYDDKNNLTLMEISDRDGNAAFTISPLQGQSSISLKDGSIYGCVIKDIKNDIDFTFENGKMSYTSADVFGADLTPEPTYVRNPNKTNLENATSYLDSMMQDYDYRLSGKEIFGASSWEVAMRAFLLTSSKFQITYGNEASFLQSSLSESERQTFDEYATFLMDSVINPQNYNYLPTADELAMWMALQSPIASGSPYGFSLTVVHGMCLPGKGSGFDTTWADRIRDVKVGGKNFVLTVNTWNAKGMGDDLDTGMIEYMRDPDKRRDILNAVKQDIKFGWENAQLQGIPFDIAAHSFGTVIVYEALGELKTEMPDMQVRNVFLMGSPLGYFVETGKVVYDQDAFDKVTNVVNIYNPRDEMNLLRAGAVGAISQNPLLRILIQSDSALGDKPLSRELKPMFSVINDYKTDVPHGAMWQDPKILRIVEESGIFTN